MLCATTHCCVFSRRVVGCPDIHRRPLSLWHPQKRLCEHTRPQNSVCPVAGSVQECKAGIRGQVERDPASCECHCIGSSEVTSEVQVGSRIEVTSEVQVGSRIARWPIQCSVSRKIHTLGEQLHQVRTQGGPPELLENLAIRTVAAWRLEEVAAWRHGEKQQSS